MRKLTVNYDFPLSCRGAELETNVKRREFSARFKWCAEFVLSLESIEPGNNCASWITYSFCFRWRQSNALHPTKSYSLLYCGDVEQRKKRTFFSSKNIHKNCKPIYSGKTVYSRHDTTSSPRRTLAHKLFSFSSHTIDAAHSIRNSNNGKTLARTLLSFMCVPTRRQRYEKNIVNVDDDDDDDDDNCMCVTKQNRIIFIWLHAAVCWLVVNRDTQRHKPTQIPFSVQTE